MLKFSIKYSVWLSLLCLFIIFEAYSPLYFLNAWQTQLTLYFTQIWIEGFHIPVQMLGNSLNFNHGLELLILDECNGALPILMYIAGVLAFPSDCRIKIVWVLIGYLGISVVNMARIYLVTYLVLDSADQFQFAHDYIGRFLILAGTFILFYIFVSMTRIMWRSKCFNRNKVNVKNFLN